VVEVGDVESVIKHPKHPYTQLLVQSIPLPDPSSRWGGGTVTQTAEEIGARPAQGCRFAPRCPSVMPICRETPPPLFRADHERGAACWLYKTSPQTAPAEMLESKPVS
jgi:oligopeptide/dipeptide ABC transporter ATP-binding protein